MIKPISLSLLSALFPFAIQAATITSDTTYITHIAQKYKSKVGIENGDSYSNLFLDLTAKGDYDRVSNEYIQFAIDGIVLAKWNAGTPDINVTTNSALNDYTLTGSIAISSELWRSLIADEVLRISWKNGPRTNAYPDIAGADYVSYTLRGDIAPATSNLSSAAVPLPATWLLLSTGLLGIGIGKRKSMDSAQKI
ncbi:MAG: PEP-CTERM sorting domain-containing protein [Methylococcaceae bacterium]|nr:PEP-CTERM sorting domain-containing protein [Methylococcaceae bacterium]